jgi:S1-C subfamily serine protease
VIVYVASIGMIVLGTLCLALALLVRRGSAGGVGRALPLSEERPTAVTVEDTSQFRSLLNEEAPHLLQHLSRWRLRVGSEALQTLVTEYIESSGMSARNELLASFIGFYGPNGSERELEDALASALDKMEEIAEGANNVTALLDEVRHASPAQLGVWALLRDLLEAAEGSPAKLKHRIAAVQPAPEPAVAQGIEHEMTQLLGSLKTLSSQLSSSLPPRWVKEKAPRRRALEKSLSRLDDWAHSSPAFTSPVLAGLPEGILTRRLTAKLWANLNGFLAKSGGTVSESNWPEMAGIISADAPRSFSRSRSRAFALMAVVAMLFYGVAGWLIFRPQRFDVDRALLNVVQIETPNATGTGFFVSPGGWIVSNYHVVKGFSQVTVKVKRPGKPSAPQSLMAEVVAHGKEEDDDVAILRISGSAFFDDLPQGLPLERAPSFRVGQRVRVMGNPLGLQDVYTEGVISKVDRGKAMMDVRIGPGSSGGPVCDDRGVVLGITTAYATAASTSFGLGIAIPSTQAWRLIDQIEKGAVQ